MNFFDSPLKLILLASMALSSCSYRIEKDSGESKISAELMNRVSYNLVKAQVFDRSCIMCHGNSGGVNLETYEQAVSVLEKIRISTVVAGRMPKPPIPALDTQQMEILRAWIATDGRRLPADGSEDPPQVSEPLEPKFASIEKLILKQKCLSCHGPGGNAARVSLASPQEMIDSPLEILLPGNPEESGLILVLLETARKRMPPRDSQFSAVKPEEIQVISDWIRNGAID